MVVLDGFTSGQSSEAIENAILILDLKSEIVEWLSVLLDVTASLADHNGACLTTKDILKEVLLWGTLNLELQSVNHDI